MTKEIDPTTSVGATLTASVIHCNIYRPYTTLYVLMGREMGMTEEDSDNIDLLFEDINRQGIFSCISNDLIYEEK